MHFNRRITASLIALAATSAVVAGGSASVGADPAQTPGVSTPCLDDVTSMAPDLDDDATTTAGSLPLIGQALGGGVLASGVDSGARQVPLDCVGVDVPPDGFLIDRLRITPGG